MDHLAASSDLHVNLHALLGKLSSTSSLAGDSGTPIAAPKIADVFKTPDVIDEEEETEDNDDKDQEQLSLGQRLGLDEVLGQEKKPAAAKKGTGTIGGTGLPKFQASLAWASELSLIHI